MKIIYIKLVNFNSVHAAMGVNEIEFDFSKIDKPIIQIYGKNHCGKTVLIQQLHPFSSINLSGDERTALNLILPNETGVKNIVYEMNGEVYNIRHVYKPSVSGHTISSSIEHNGEELNPSGGVNTFNTLISSLFGINKYISQFVINGTQLTSFANMSVTQRKNLLNKAMGIDIYDKINKMATDDYRYSNKMLISLSNTKEFLLNQYGSYENLCNVLRTKRNEYSTLSTNMSTCKSRIDNINGKLSMLHQQNIAMELVNVENQINNYDSVLDTIGTSFTQSSYNDLIDSQISLNSEVSELKSKRLLILKDIDVLYSDKQNLENKIYKKNKVLQDHNDLVNTKESLINKIKDIHIEEVVTSSSDYLKNMISIAQIINSTCKEIVISLNPKHLKMFTDMINKNIDISAFLMREGSVLMDSKKEISTISRVRSIINSVDGDYIDDCQNKNCIYWKTVNTLNTYFKSYQSMTDSQFTEYDIEQFEISYKNIQSIKRLMSIQLTDEIKNIFNINTIMLNLCNGNFGIDIDRLTFLMEQAAFIELKNKYISQVTDIERILDNQLSNDNDELSNDELNEHITTITNKISQLNVDISNIDCDIKTKSDLVTNYDTIRLKYSSIQNIDIKELRNKLKKLNKSNETMNTLQIEYQQLNSSYIQMKNEFNTLTTELDNLENANRQYQTNTADIEKYQISDSRHKIIAEATSSTKGKPVIVIRDKVESALTLGNRLLDVMYDGDMEFLKPTINEDSFIVPFRNGANTSPDIRYGSQSESSLLSFALSLSFASSLTKYNIPLVDEIDAYLDGYMSDKFVLMLQEIMSTLKMEQLFIISHKITPHQYDGIIHLISLT